VQGVLTERFNLKLITTVDRDLKEIMLSA